MEHYKVPYRLVIDHTLTNRQKTMGEIGTRNPPYLAILLTPTVWIAMFSDFANSIASYIVIIEGPNFFKNILKVDISQVLILLLVRLNRDPLPHPYPYHSNFHYHMGQLVVISIATWVSFKGCFRRVIYVRLAQGLIDRFGPAVR